MGKKATKKKSKMSLKQRNRIAMAGLSRAAIMKKVMAAQKKLQMATAKRKQMDQLKKKVAGKLHRKRSHDSSRLVKIGAARHHHTAMETAFAQLRSLDVASSKAHGKKKESMGDLKNEKQEAEQLLKASEDRKKMLMQRKRNCSWTNHWQRRDTSKKPVRRRRHC